MSGSDWWVRNEAEVAGLVAIASLVGSLVLVLVTARYVRLTRELTESSRGQLDQALQGNEIAREAIAQASVDIQRQLEEARRARWSTTTPQVTVELLEERVSPTGRLKAVQVVDLRVRLQVANHGPGAAVIALMDTPVGRWTPGPSLEYDADAPGAVQTIPSAHILPANGALDLGWRYVGGLAGLVDLGEAGLEFEIGSRGVASPVQDRHTWSRVRTSGLTPSDDGAFDVRQPLLSLSRVATDRRSYPPVDLTDQQ